MKQIITLIQFILGFIIGVLILAGGTAGAGYYFLSKMASSPPKPTFNEEKAPETQTKETKATATPTSTPKATATPTPKATATPTPKATPTPEKEKEEEKLPQGAYKARVSWNSGLVIRSSPTMDGSRAGGVYYNDQIVILEEKDGWQKIRTSSGVEGWVKSGNTAKVE